MGKQESELQEWQGILEINFDALKEELNEKLVPSLAGRVLYNIYKSKSWEFAQPTKEQLGSITCWTNGESETFDGTKIKNVTTYSHGYSRQYEHYYTPRSFSESDLLKRFFEAEQFEEHHGIGDFNLPCTWEDMMEEWYRDLEPLEALSAFLNKKVSKEVRQFFEKECAKENVNFSWHEIYVNEFDGGILSDTLLELFFAIYEGLESRKIADFRARHEMDFQRYLRQKKEAEKLEKERFARRKHEHKKLIELGRNLLPIFRQRLSAKFGLTVVKNLRFSKDKGHWKELKGTLETFNTKERGAIIAASDASLSAQNTYVSPKDPLKLFLAVTKYNWYK